MKEKGSMFTPESFIIRYVTSRNMPYGVEETSTPNMLSGGGVLKKGQAVWLKEALNEKSREAAVPAYVEELGVVLLDARFLVDHARPLASSVKDAGQEAKRLPLEYAVSTT
jgi:hypothetical protein